MNGYTEALTRKIGATAFEERLTTFMNLFHEFRHVKQNELMYKADSARLVRAKIAELEKSNNASWQEILKNCGGDKNKAIKMVQEEIERVYKDIWGHLKPAPKTSTATIISSVLILTPRQYLLQEKMPRELVYRTLSALKWQTL